MKELITIQSKLKAPKSQFNSFGKYHYRNCEDIFEAVKPLLKETDTYLTLDDEIIMVGERYYVKATAQLWKDKEVIACTRGYAREEETKKGMDASQITGSSSSYARKSALGGMFCLDDNKDSDTTYKGQPEPKLITQDQAKDLDKLLYESGADPAKFLEYFGVRKLQEMNTDQLKNATQILKEKIAKK